jgi:uncharacterized protein
MSNIFLKASWQKLVMANYALDSTLLEKYLPYKTELDFWNGTCYVSLVGFMFQDTQVKGLKIPFHVNFEEVNLRFYVRYKDNGVWKRGVVFIKEIVPKPLLALVANTLYKEHYITLPMTHEWTAKGNELVVAYKWKKNTWQSLKIVVQNKPLPMLPNSEEEFITEHYWGYTKITANQTAEYAVEHPKWEVYQTKSFEIDVDFAALYGQEFGELSKQKPQSVFLAEGSEIFVKHGNMI